MTEPTDTPPADLEHPTGGGRRRRPGGSPRRGVQSESNFRLWWVVAALLLVLPLAVVGVRGMSSAEDRAGAPVPPPVPSPATTTQPVSTPPASTPPASTPPTQTAPADEPEDERSDEGPTEQQGPTKPAAEQSVPTSGPQSYITVDRPVEPATDAGALLRYRVRIEENLDLDARQTARTVADILNDERSWTGDGSVRFEQVGPETDYDFTLYVVTPDTTDVLCAPLDTGGEVSCRNGDDVVLNAKRWVLGAEPFGDDLTGYRQYLVNHEVGHRLGYGHVDCLVPGDPAPIMMQQTKSVGECEPHPWVKPGDR